MQPTPLRADTIAAILAALRAQTSFRSIDGGAADGQSVGWFCAGCHAFSVVWLSCSGGSATRGITCSWLSSNARRAWLSSDARYAALSSNARCAGLPSNARCAALSSSARYAAFSSDAERASSPKASNTNHPTRPCSRRRKRREDRAGFRIQMHSTVVSIYWWRRG